PLELNRFDAYAVAHAARLREEEGGEVVAMTMGPPQAEEALRTALALGADRCVHLSDRLFAVADTLGTSRTLAMAIRKEGADLVPDAKPGDRRFGQTGSPTRVLAVRDVSPERAQELFTDPAAAAARVRELLEERPAPETSWEKPERLGEQPGASYDSWSLVELVEGRPARVSLELLAKGRELAGKLGGKNVALLLGHGLDEAAREAVRHGAGEVVTVDDQRLREYEPEVWAGALRQVLERERPHALLIPATSRGRDYGPRAAGELELGMTGDCVDLGIDRAGRLIQHKP